MSVGLILTLGLGAFTGGGVKYLPTLGYGTGGAPPPPPPVVVPPSAPTIGGMGRYEVQRLPKKREIIFRRSMENQDRADIEDIIRLLDEGGLL